jgi:hypothetical protein
MYGNFRNFNVTNRVLIKNPSLGFESINSHGVHFESASSFDHTPLQCITETKLSQSNVPIKAINNWHQKLA